MSTLQGTSEWELRTLARRSGTRALRYHEQNDHSHLPLSERALANVTFDWITHRCHKINNPLQETFPEHSRSLYYRCSGDYCGNQKLIDTTAAKKTN